MSESIEFVDKEGNLFTIKVLPFENITTEDFIHTDIHNIYAELISMPVVLNMVGNWKALKQEELRNKIFDLEVLEAQVSEDIRNEYNELGKKITEERLKNLVKLNSSIQSKRKKVIKCQKELEQIDSIFWSAKDKSEKLRIISEKLKPEEFNTEIIIKKINSVKIKYHGNINK